MGIDEKRSLIKNCSEATRIDVDGRESRTRRFSGGNSHRIARKDRRTGKKKNF